METTEKSAPKYLRRTESQKIARREHEQALRAARLAADCCTLCGVPRIPKEKGGTPNACAVCAQKRRERPDPRDVANNRRWRQALRQRREQAARCLLCGKKRHAGDARYCLTCRFKQNTRGAAHRQRKRERLAQATGQPTENRIYTNKPLLPLEGKRIGFTVGLDTRTLWALENLMARYESEERAAGRVPQPRQTSRLVRETILRWQNKRCPPPIALYGVARRHLTVSLDEPSGFVLRYQADTFFDGNLACAFRALLQTAHAPHRAFTGSSVFSPRIKRF